MKENIRPWGRYEVIEKTKIIYVNPNSKLSLQYHNYRDEEWIILDGFAVVTIGEKKFDAREGDRFKITRGVKHRIETFEDSCKFIEISTGEVDEDDIVRLEDSYGRVN